MMAYLVFEDSPIEDCAWCVAVFLVRADAEDYAKWRKETATGPLERSSTFFVSECPLNPDRRRLGS
jgi:hypothetical protein